MKRIIGALVAVLALLVGLLTACALPSKGAFVYDETYHWRQKDGDVVNKGTHDFRSDGDSAGGADECATVTETCTICGYSRTVTQHRSDGYRHDKDGHWQNYVCAHNVDVDKQPHIYKCGVCTVCGRLSVAELVKFAVQNGGFRCGWNIDRAELPPALKEKLHVGADSAFVGGKGCVTVDGGGVKTCLSMSFQTDRELPVEGGKAKFSLRSSINLYCNGETVYVEQNKIDDGLQNAETVFVDEEAEYTTLSYAEVAEYLNADGAYGRLSGICTDVDKFVALARFAENLIQLAANDVGKTDGGADFAKLFVAETTDGGTTYRVNFALLSKLLQVLQNKNADEVAAVADKSVADEVRSWWQDGGADTVRRLSEVLSDNFAMSFAFDNDGQFDKITFSADLPTTGNCGVFGGADIALTTTRQTDEFDESYVKRLADGSTAAECVHEWSFSQSATACDKYVFATAVCDKCKSTRSAYVRAPHTVQTKAQLAKGATHCADGVVYTDMCYVCGTKIDEHTEYDCVVDVDVTLYGKCNHQVHYGKCLCGDKTVLEFDGLSPSEFDALTADGKFALLQSSSESTTYKCVDCNLVVRCDVTYVNRGDGCNGRADYTVTFDDGVTKNTHTYAEIVDGHRFVDGEAVLVGESCEEGWYNKLTCVFCGYADKSALCYEHKTAPHEKHYVVCKNGHNHEWVETYCPCKAVCFLQASEVDCVGTTETYENVTTTKYDCGVTTITRVSHSVSGCYDNIEERTTIMTDDIPLSVNLNRRTTCHDYTYTVKSHPDDCTVDGVTLLAECACGRKTTLTKYEHAVTHKQGFEIDDESYELREICSACGKNVATLGVYPKETETHVKGVTFYTLTGKSCTEGWREEYLCALCGLRCVSSDGQGHVYREVYSLAEGATSCTDGCVRTTMCIVCGEVQSTEIVYVHGTNSYETDLCGQKAVLHINACPCGEKLDYTFRSAVDDNPDVFFVGKTYLFGKCVDDHTSFDLTTNTLLFAPNFAAN